MKNYYKLMLDELKECLSDTKRYLICDAEEDNNVERTETTIEALELTIDYINLRFKNNLKQYNNDEEKAYDKFSAKKCMEYFNIYVEEFYDLDPNNCHDDKFRKELRDIIHILWNVINNN